MFNILTFNVYLQKLTNTSNALSPMSDKETGSAFEDVLYVFRHKLNEYNI